MTSVMYGPAMCCKGKPLSGGRLIARAAFAATALVALKKKGTQRLRPLAPHKYAGASVTPLMHL